MASLVAQRLKRLPAVRETWVRSLVQEDPLEKEIATHSSNLAWRIPWMEELGASVHGVAKNWTQPSTLLLLLLFSHFSHVQVWVTLWTVAHLAPLSMEVSRSAGVGCHALLQGIFPT